MEMRQFKSNIQLREISQLVIMYKSAHSGNAPTNLSELVPNHRTDLISLFHAPNQLMAQVPTHLSTNKTALNQTSDYCVSLDVNTGIVAYERPELWSDGSVAVCYTNLDVKRMKISEFNAPQKKLP